MPEIDLAVGAAGLLGVFHAAGVLDFADVQVAQRITVLAGERDETVALAVALLVRALRGGSVCLDLGATAADLDAPELPWPEPVSWLATVRSSVLVGTPPVLRCYQDRLLYLDRYWREEEQVCTDLLALATPAVPADATAYARLFPPGYEEQRAAAEAALSQAVTVLTGGPGTGKTTTVARLLALLAEQAAERGTARLRIALVAPTGKAAARLGEAVAAEIAALDPADQTRLAGLEAMTLHRLLGPRPDTSVRFKHHRGNRLPHHVIVVDETSMVSLTMMARLTEAIRPDARLILVGDPDQLASVEAGAVLADLVDGLAARPDRRVIALRRSHRFGESIGGLAEAIRIGDADQAIALLRAGGPHIEWIDDAHPAERLRPALVRQAQQVREAALLGAADLALKVLDEHRLLCAHRSGPHGVAQWNHQVQQWLSQDFGTPVWSQWYAGRPVLVTANDYGLGVYNGDTGVVVVDPEHVAGLRVAISGASSAAAPRQFSPTRLSDVETMYAMTIHKTQGSQAAEVTVLLPPAESRLLTRELFYTAVTRAKHKVRLVGPEASVRAALARRAARATGLGLRLQPGPTS